MKSIELSLLKGRLTENGKIDENGEELSKGSNKILVTLHNVEKPLKSIISTRDAEFEDGNEYVFSEQYDEEPYLSTTFRGEVYESSYIEVEVTSVVKATKAAKVIYKLLNGISESAIEMLPGGEIVTSVTKVISSSLFEILKPEDKIQVIGRGVEKIDLNKLNGEITIPLIVPKMVKMTKVTYEARVAQQKRKDRAIRKLHQLSLNEGVKNGFITLTILEV